MKVEFEKYYWAKFIQTQEILIAWVYDDGFSGSVDICGVEDHFGLDDFEFLKEVEPYES